MTTATLARAIMAVRPETSQHLAIAIASNSLGYGAAYAVPPELVAARILSRNGREEAHAIPFVAQFIAGEAKGLRCRYAALVMGAAKRLASLAESYPSAKCGAE